MSPAEPIPASSGPDANSSGNHPDGARVHP